MKKLVTLALAGVCALAFVAAVDAGTVVKQEAPKVQHNITTLADSEVWANKANAWNAVTANVSYIIADQNLSSSATVNNALKKALNDASFSALLNTPTSAIEGYRIAVASGSYSIAAGDVEKWKDAEWVARNILPGRCASMSTGDSVDQSKLDKLEAEDKALIEAEQKAVADYDKAYNERKAAWEAENPDGDYSEIESYEPPVNSKDGTTRVKGNGGHTLTIDEISSTGFKYAMVDGKLTKINTVEVTRQNVTLYTQSASKFVSPLVLDITGNGVLQASNGQNMPGHPSVTTNVILADFYGDGFEIGMEWVGPQDGLLVAPKADGSVDMSSLFGTAGGYESGYEKLSLYDKNNDNKVNGEELVGLSVWQDANGNGVADAGEVKTVQELGITEISLNADAKFVSSFTMNGQTNKMWDWWPNAIELIKVANK